MTELADPAHIDFASAFVPTLLVVSNKFVDLTGGVHIGSVAALLWGMVLYRNASIEQDTVSNFSDRSIASSFTQPCALIACSR
jgi:putative effector of murein hydrolase